MMGKKLQQYLKILLIILGFIIFILYIWFRFIRERLPKNLPFIDLSEFDLLRLFYVCGIYFYIIFCYFKKGSNSNEISLKIVEIIYLPLKTFDKYLKEKSLLKKNNTKFLIYLSKQKFWYYVDGLFFFYFFEIFPRIILIIAFLVDVFYFHKLYFIYKILFIGILILLGKYLKYSYKALKDQMLEEHTYKIEILMEFYDALKVLDKLDKEDDYEYDPACDNSLIIPLDIFINNQNQHKLLNLETTKFEIDISVNYKFFFKQEGGYIKLGYKTNQGDDYLDFKNKHIIIVDNLLNISYIIEYLQCKANSNKIKYLKILIFSNYFLIWLYIIIISLPYIKLDYMLLINLLETTLKYIENYEEPF